MSSFLFVCLGNICRSPALQGLLEQLFQEKKIAAHVESCGLSFSCIGSPPDRQMQKVAQKHAITLKGHAKVFQDVYFETFDVIFCVTEEILSAVRSRAATQEERDKVLLATHYSSRFKDQPIPDPYRGPDGGFEKAWEIIEDACNGILHYYHPRG